jgi:hypothetical protein
MISGHTTAYGLKVETQREVKWSPIKNSARLKRLACLQLSPTTISTANIRVSAVIMRVSSADTSFIDATPALTGISQPIETPPGCTWIRNMRNPRGEYLKTICYMVVPQSQALARTYCGNRKMSLLTLDTAEVRKAVFDQSNKEFPAGWILWVDGKNATTGTCNAMRKLTVFDGVPYLCTNYFYFFCEYTSEIRKHERFRDFKLDLFTEPADNLI